MNARIGFADGLVVALLTYLCLYPMMVASFAVAQLVAHDGAAREAAGMPPTPKGWIVKGWLVVARNGILGAVVATAIATFYLASRRALYFREPRMEDFTWAGVCVLICAVSLAISARRLGRSEA